MQFLKTLFWVITAVIAVVFSIRNWTAVSINLWGGLQADVKLPLLMVVAVILGFLPTYILYRGSRWQMQRRIDNIERNYAVAKSEVAIAPEPTFIPPVTAEP